MDIAVWIASVCTILVLASLIKVRLLSRSEQVTLSLRMLRTQNNACGQTRMNYCPVTRFLPRQEPELTQSMDLNIKPVVSTAAEAVTMMLQKEVEDHRTCTKRD